MRLSNPSIKRPAKGRHKDPRFGNMSPIPHLKRYHLIQLLKLWAMPYPKTYWVYKRNATTYTIIDKAGLHKRSELTISLFLKPYIVFVYVYFSLNHNDLTHKKNPNRGKCD